MTATPSLSLHEVTVRFGSTIALDKVSLDLPPGSRVAVVGENGAGKSTLMKVLFGLVRPDSGELRVEGKAMSFASPRDAIATRIGMVQQHFDLIGPFTVAENIILGNEPQTGGRFDKEEALRRVTSLMHESGLEVSPTLRVDQLSVAAQQRVEILKALYRQARVLILDEPTATLAPTEAQELWSATRRLTDAGATLVFITHKLDEVMENADTVLVLRRGKPILTRSIADTNSVELANAMVGGTLDAPKPRQTLRGNPEQGLVLENISVEGPRPLETISFRVAPGEIVGIAGVDGSGQTELIEALVGLRPLATGTLRGGGAPWNALTIAQRRAAGLAFIPEDRHRYAVAPQLSLIENAILGRQREPLFSRYGKWLDTWAQQRFLADCAQTYDIRGAELPHTPLTRLSGGNQQKLVLARELSRNPRIIVAAQPTRGLDFAATAFVHQSLREAADKGAAVLIQSLDLTELFALADRIAVLLKGRLVGLLSREEASEERVGALMTGARP